MGKRYGIWEFRNYSNIINPNIELIDDFVNMSTKLQCRCKLCGGVSEYPPRKILNISSDGKRGFLRHKLCQNPECREVILQNQTLKHQERVLQEISKIQSIASGKYELLDDYVSEESEISCKCLKCGNIWKSLPYNLSLKRSKCPVCSAPRKADRNTRLLAKAQSLIYKYSQYFNIELDNKLVLHCTCKKCGYTFTIDNYENRNQISCKQCESDIRNKNNDALIMSGLTNIRRTEGEFCYLVNTKYQGVTLKEIPKDAYYYTYQEIVTKVNTASPNIEILDKGILTSKKVLCRCKICGSRWATWISHLLNGSSCPNCKGSRGEKIIAGYLDEHGIKYEREYSFKDCKNKLPLRFDFYLPDINSVIEYDGLQHYKPIDFSGKETKRQTEINYASLQKRDGIKNRYCKKHNIPMLRIKYDEKNITSLLEKFINKLSK